MPNNTNKPNNTSIRSNLRLCNRGSRTAVNEPGAAKQTSAIDPLAYLLLPVKNSQCKALSAPMPMHCTKYFRSIRIDCLRMKKMSNNNKDESNILYHTSQPSFNSIKRPSTPVNPAKKTAACNCKKALVVGCIKEINDCFAQPHLHILKETRLFF